MIVWITQALAHAIHDRQVSEHGGTSGLRDTGLLESALARPQQLYAYAAPAPDLADLAASLAFGIVRNHPFVDGNKRTAFVSCLSFLTLNGVVLQATAEEKYLAFLALAEGHLGVDDFAAWLREHIPSPQTDRIQESRLRSA